MNTTPDNVVIDRSRCIDLDGGRNIEWLVTNGRGGYAMASVTGLLTRRYHGLLVAAVQPPVERYVLLAKLEATVSIDGLTYELGTNDYLEAVHPHGYELLDSFEPRPFPRWRWRLGDAVVEQSLCMASGENTTFVRYRLIEGPERVRIAVRPLCTSRHYHRLARYGEMGPPTAEETADAIGFQWGGDRPAWTLSHNGAFHARPDWYYGFALRREAARGQDATQDLFMPGVVSATLQRGDSTGLVFAASTQPSSRHDAPAAFRGADRGASVRPEQDAPLPDDSLAMALGRAAREFVVSREDGSKTVIAGYPWFGDWGRDTFISLPGLCLVTGRFDDARDIIEGYSRFVDNGMIPNRFPPFGVPPAYNTVDATLWYVHAIDRFLAYTGDWDFVGKTMVPIVADILEAHERGTRHGIHLCEDGLLAAGTSGLQLTWMDAKIGDWVVTPRIGKPVEINALWFNALRIGADLVERSGDDGRAGRWRAIAKRCQASFNRRFQNAETGCLYDVVDVDHHDGEVDGAIRPNQLFAVSLTHPVLDPAHWQSVVDTCERRLWTPMGLRTLAPDDANYQPHYTGDLRARDAAYHRGTVWPWLLGPFVSAYVHANARAAKATVRRFLAGIEAHLLEAGLGGVSEVADGDPPHTPGGCPWQAWSVAEPLRALCEDVFKTHPAKPESPDAASQAVVTQSAG
ncbi:MAG: amylo-alpha-1,6-glucosidase [Phycisphaerae bacterium]